jgi:hypothetical protein
VTTKQNSEKNNLFKKILDANSDRKSPNQTCKNIEMRDLNPRTKKMLI